MALVRLLVSQTTGWAAWMTDDEYVSELARLCVSLELEARVRRVKEYNENELREAARDVLMITGAGAALADRGRQSRHRTCPPNRRGFLPASATPAFGHLG
jgi:hypothetical protein